MPSDFHFRFATCLTLVLACIGLGYSEWDLIPGVILVTSLVVGFIVAAFVWEGRITLSLRTSNLFGGGIAFATAAWLVSEVSRLPDGYTGLLLQPGLLLPYVGPFLMVLIPAKLLRPKHLGDWWSMQGIGLAAVALGASMSETETYAALLVMYSASAVWSVSILYLRTASGQIAPIPRGRQPSTIPIQTSERTFQPRPLISFLAKSMAAALIVGLVLFLITPRVATERWAFGKSRLETGFTLENSHDINRAGDLGINRDLALRVVATNADGTPKTDLDGEALWRGVSYSDYEDGKWVRRSFPSGPNNWIRTGRVPLDAPKPVVGPGTFQLEFQPEDNSPGTVILSPPLWKVGGEIPVRSLGRTEQSPWLPIYDGSFSPDSLNRRWYAYRQWSREGWESGLGEGFELSPIHQFPRTRSVLTTMRVGSIRQWAAAKFEKFVRDGAIPAAALTSADTRAGFDVSKEHYEVTARAFAEYFRTTAEYAYTLKLRRQDRRLDPIEDFLFNTKAGHCQWFASALCLSLRSLGIPAQFVMGYRGFEAGDEGNYFIRQENAHAWVEVMVPRPAPEGFPFQDPETAKSGNIWHWLTLDPTPVFNIAAVKTNWFDDTNWRTAIGSIMDFILNYDADKQQLLGQIGLGRIAGFLACIGLVPLFIWGWRRLRRSLARNRIRKMDAAELPIPEWYRELLRVMAHGGIVADAGQTPKELAEKAGQFLRERFEDVAAIPAFVTSKLYRMRYAGIPLTEEELAEVSKATSELEARLTAAEGDDTSIQ
jgi:transglutaminase-like putative cysteine protease